jgi:hypothetical protein
VDDAVSELKGLPRGMRDAVLAALGPDERIVAVWSTRGIGANALVCTSTRALTAKRTELIRWSVAAFPYPEIASVEVIEGRPGAAAQLMIVPPEPRTPPEPGPFDDHPDAYFQESRRLVAPNTVMFRGSGRAREAAETLRELIAEHRRP